MEKLKHKLPSYGIVTHLAIEPELLNDLKICIGEVETEFKSVLEVNRSFCGNSYELTKKSVYDDTWKHISLTDSIFENESITIDQFETLNDQMITGSRSQAIRNKKQFCTTDSVMNESTFIKKTAIYLKYEQLFNTVLSKFKGTPTRVRLAKLESGSTVNPHIDYDPGYLVRIIMPIIAEPECVNLFWVKNKIESVSFRPGLAYFLNTGYKHAVVNLSSHDRYALTVSVKGTQDIEHLYIN